MVRVTFGDQAFESSPRLDPVIDFGRLNLLVMIEVGRQLLKREVMLVGIHGQQAHFAAQPFQGSAKGGDSYRFPVFEWVRKFFAKLKYLHVVLLFGYC